MKKDFTKERRRKRNKTEISRKLLRYVNDSGVGPDELLGSLPLSQHQHKDTGTPYVNLSHYFSVFSSLLFFPSNTFLKSAGKRCVMMKYHRQIYTPRSRAAGMLFFAVLKLFAVKHFWRRDGNLYWCAFKNHIIILFNFFWPVIVRC